VLIHVSTDIVLGYLFDTGHADPTSSSLPGRSKDVIKRPPSMSAPMSNKFVEPVSDVMPPAIPLWVDALKAVKTDPHRLVEHPHKGLLVGYQFPDPHLFLSTSRQSIYVASWLSCRAGWIQTVVSNCGEHPVPKTQQWRQFLFDKRRATTPAASLSGPLLRPVAMQHRATKMVGKVTPIKSSAKSAQEGRRREKLTATAHEIFSLRLPSSSFPEQIFWNEVAVQDGDVSLLTPVVTSQVLWDLFEHNFRLELLALDRCVMSTTWADPLQASA
jgi:hypothetical protein